MAFYGNNDCTVTAINVAGGITCSRTSGQTPMFVQVSASAIAATGSRATGQALVPYEDLEYSWDFGDPSGTEILTDPRPFLGGSVNVNTQDGPEAAYCYRSSGTFTVTLTIRGKNGGSYTTAQTTQNITVTTYSASGGDRYVDSVNGNDAWDGTAPAFVSGTTGPKQSLTGINGLIGANRAVHLARGSSWTYASSGHALTIDGASSPLRIDAYGSGADPIVTTTANNSRGMEVNSFTGTNISDVVISDLAITHTSTGGGDNACIEVLSNGSSSYGTISHLYLDNCTFLSTGTAATVFFQNYTTTTDPVVTVSITKVGLWNCTADAPWPNSLGTINLVSYMRCNDWGFIVGGHIIGATTDGVAIGTNHVIYYIFQTHALSKYCQWKGGAYTAFCINGDWDNWTPSSTIYTDYWCMVKLDLSYSNYGIDNGAGSGAVGADVRARNWVIESCTFHDMVGFGTQGTASAMSATFRDNEFWAITAGPLLYANGPIADFAGCFYRNKLYRPSGGAASGCLSFNVDSPPRTTPMTITDNIIQDQRASSLVTNIGAWASFAANTLIDRNQYYTPSDTTVWGEADVGKSLALWQAAGFDTSVSLVNPNWNAPQIGDFSQAGSGRGSDIIDTFPDFSPGQTVYWR